MIIDIGASENVVASINLFHSVMDVEEGKVDLANGKRVNFRHNDKALFDTGTMTLVLSTVHFIPTLQLNLLSCFRLDEFEITAVVSKKTCN